MARRTIAPRARDGRSRYLSRRLVPLGLILIGFAVPAHADEMSPALPGASLADTLAIARQLSPDLAARALDTEAAQARVRIAGSLPDPTLHVTSDEIDRTSGPRQNKMIYGVEQSIPLWGKRGLSEDMALASVDQTRADARETENELIEKVKVAFAQYYQTDQSIRTTEKLHQAVHGIAIAARDRYAQGLGSQQDVYGTEVESVRFMAELVRLSAARRAAAGRLNALLARPIEAPLATPSFPRVIPPVADLDPDALLDRTRASNPTLASDQALIAAALANRALAGKSWYPDVTVGAGYIDRTGNGPNGYTATIGFQVPLEWGLHQAQEHEAAAALAADQARKRSRELAIEGDLAEAVASLKGSEQTATLIKTQLLPQSEAMFQSGVASYGFGKVSLTDVLRAEHDLVDLRTELLSTEFDEQRQLATIERLIGGDL